MKYNYEIIDEFDREILFEDEIHKLIKYILKLEQMDNAVFNIIFVDNKYIKKLNSEYRNKDAVTDVISFALLDDNSFIEGKMCVLGDIYISTEKCMSQAKEYGNTLKRETLFLCTHGMLHLLGFDHITKKQEKIMFDYQELILNEYDKI
ncbi:MAG: rRNA maturation RNase YbeY [Bacilli bacterium]